LNFIADYLIKHCWFFESAPIHCGNIKNKKELFRWVSMVEGKAVVLAGGKGVRLRPYTDDRPKVMIDVNGKPLLHYLLKNMKEAGIDEANIIVGYMKEVIEDYFGENFQGMHLNYFVQEKQLGTAHAVSLVQGYVTKNFLVLNGDVVVEKELISGLMKVDEFDPYDAMLVAREVNDPWRYGCLKVEGDELKGIVEKPSMGSQPSNLINAGIYRFNQKIFPAILMTELSARNEFELVDSIMNMIGYDGRVGIRKYAGKVIDVGDEGDLERAKQVLK
jgi:bifunctional UDP-N-acetylglucosamine pyrophosphorylase/glucosamine-1-phosphate N-acetyltransferase